MKPKKYSNADLNKRSGLFLQLGLILVLLSAYFIINWRNSAPQKTAMTETTLETPTEEVVPVTEYKETPPPKLPEAPEILDIEDNDAPVEEDDIAPTESDQDAIAEVSEIVEAKDDEPVATVPYEFLENVPVFPGCENLGSNKERKACMSKKIKEFVNSHFDTGLGDELGLSGVNRVNVLFKIDTHGNVTEVQARAPHPELEEEAKRIIKELPHMQPGKQRGKPVIVSYALPIIFQVQ